MTAYDPGMKQITAMIALLCLFSTPSLAEESAEDNGRPLIEEGLRLFMEGMMREMQPALEDLEGMADEMRPALRDFMREMGPALARLLSDIEDLSAYEPPEILPNGDIIIRRKPPQDEVEPAPQPEDEIEI